MGNSGIISQYGFLYQRKVFVLFVLRNLNLNTTFFFEGKDDIDVISDDKIYGLSITGKSYIQVKSGSVSQSCFCKVICNWLLGQSSEEEFILIHENDLLFKWDKESLADAVYTFALLGKEKKRSSIARKVYEEYRLDIEKNEGKQFRQDIIEILNRVTLKKYLQTDLTNELETVYFENYCQDITEYDIAKKKRLESLLRRINEKIDRAIEKKQTFTITFAEAMKEVITVSEEINDHRYCPSIPTLKKKFRENAGNIVAERKKREVKQLFLVNSNVDFVIKGIVDELFYEDFRNVYIGKKDEAIANLEELAVDNYEEAVLFCGNDATAKEKYEKTLQKRIEAELLPPGAMYQKGCYIFLTGDNIEEEKQISWGEENDIQ